MSLRTLVGLSPSSPVCRANHRSALAPAASCSLALTTVELTLQRAAKYW